MYHIDDAYENATTEKFRDVVGMTAGNWHRLDNIGAIFSMNLSTWLHLRFPSDAVRQSVVYASRKGDLRPRRAPFEMVAHPKDCSSAVGGRRSASPCSARNAVRGTSA